MITKYTEFYRPILIFLFCLTIHFLAYSQDKFNGSENNILSNIIEDYLSNNEDATVDPTYLYDQLNDLKNNPIDINAASQEEWQQLFFIDAQLINAIIQYQKAYGPFLSVYELQAVPYLNVEDVRKILPFVKQIGSNSAYFIPLGTLLTKGKNDLYLKCERLAEQQVGFSDNKKSTGGSYYKGDPNKLFVRFRHQYSNKFSIGFTAEKDPGEEFFTGSNPKGFDYYTFHAFSRNYSNTISALAIGDYAVSFGQGLILYSGFGYGKSSYATLIKRTGPVLIPYSSTLENNSFRGGGITLNIDNHLEFTGFVSQKYNDGNLIKPDSIIEYDFSFSSLQSSGLHRTQSEIEDKHSVKVRNAGFCTKYKFKAGTIALNGLYTDYDKAFIKESRIDNQFSFSGTKLMNLSIDYSYIYRNIYFFGEFAKADQPDVAAVNGALISLDRHIDLAILHRYLPINYHAINANVFAEGSEPSNENGFYIGTQIYPDKQWTINAYFDVWKNPWLKYTVSKPSTGAEYLVKVQYTVKRKIDMYIQFRDESKDQNISNDATLQNVGIQNRRNLRFHISNKVSPRLELRSRIEWSFFKGANGIPSRGFMLYQDVLYKPISFPVSFTSRLAFFDTQDYNSRIYAYENDLLYSFSIPPYYFKGMRWYINIRTRINKNFMVEAGISQTVLTNQTSIGSGLDQINAPHKTELKAQVKYSF